MANLKGINVSSMIVPFTDQDTYPIFDPIYGIGGWREVADIATRNAIPTDRLRTGMIVMVQGDQPYMYNGAGWDPLIGVLNSSYQLLTNLSTDGTLVNNSNTLYPSVQAVKTYVDGQVSILSTSVSNETSRATTAESLKEDAANKDTDVALTADSDVKYPSQKAVKSYTDGAVAVETSRAESAEAALQKYVAIPASSTSTGSAGQYSVDGTYLYVCYGTDTWARVALDLTAF